MEEGIHADREKSGKATWKVVQNSNSVRESASKRSSSGIRGAISRRWIIE